MADFVTAFHHVLGHEGGYVNDKKDKGGETYKGIARNYWPDWEGWAIIDKLKDEPNFPGCLQTHTPLQNLVKSFYKKNFWDKAGLEHIKKQSIATEIFDTAVNQGLGSAIEYLQQALNYLNRNEKDYSNISEDGVWGQQTRKAYEAYMATAEWSTRSIDKNVKTLLKALNGMQFMRYENIVRHEESQERFFYGWLNRI